MLMNAYHHLVVQELFVPIYRVLIDVIVRANFCPEEHRKWDVKGLLLIYLVERMLNVQQTLFAAKTLVDVGMVIRQMELIVLVSVFERESVIR